MRSWGWGRVGLAVALCVGLGLAAGEGVAQDEGRFEALLAEVEADLAVAPEVDRDVERWGAIGPSEARREIAIRLVEAGHFEEAAKIAVGIADPNDQARAIRDVVLAHLAREDLDPAKRLGDVDEVIAKIAKDPAIIAELVIEIAAWLEDQGDSEGSLELLGKAEEFTQFIGSQRRKGQAMAHIAMKYVELDETDRGKALVNQIEDEFWRAAGHKTVAIVMAEVGDFTGAEEVATAIDDAEIEKRDEAYVWLAESLAKAGQLDEAQRVIGLIANGADRAEAKAKITATHPGGDQTSAEVDVAEAEAIALGMVDSEDQAVAFADLALQLVKASRFADLDALAARLVKTDAKPGMISKVLHDIAEALWEVGQKESATRHLKDAERFAALIEYTEDRSDDDKDDRLRQIAKLYITFDQIGEAERVTAGIDDATDHVRALRDLGVAFARDGQISEVARLVAVISNIEGVEHWRGDGLADIARALSANGEVTAAEALVESIAEPSWRANALAEVAVALAKHARLSEAERIARRIEDPAWRAVALGAVAAGL